MFGGMFEDPFAQIKKRISRHQRKRHNQQNQGGFGNQHGNNGWGNNNNNNNNNNGWGNNNNNNNGWGNGNGFGNQFQGGNQGGSLWGDVMKGGFEWVQEMQKRHQSNITHLNFGDIKNVIQQQIVFLQPSPQKKKLQELRNQGQIYRDERFPAGLKSLTGQWGNVAEWKEIKWTPISQGIPNAKIFEGKVEPGDIAQGYLGDCYFLAALAALAEKPDRIFNLFLLNEVNAQKYYSVKMLYKGKWMTIDMDEQIPFLYGKPAFTKTAKNELWVALLQKAWAKMYSNYKRIEAGYPQEGLHDLTGAPIKNISLQQSSFNKEQEWKYLLKASQLQYSMVSSSQPGSDTQKSFSGIVQGHAYTFLNATYLNAQGQQHRLVQLRNPWGKGESKGKWSDNDSNWNYVDQNQKARIGFNPNADDGTFFMSYDDYCKEFRAMTIAQVDDNSSYIYKSHKDPQNKGCYFRVRIHKQGNYSLQLDKTPERSFPESKQEQYQYPLAQLEIGRLNGGSVQKMNGSNTRKRTLFHDIDLQPGDYIVFARIQYDSRFQTDFDVNLAVYAEYPCEVALATAQEADMMAGRNVDWSGQEQKSSALWNDLSSYDDSQGNWGNQGNQGNQGNNGWGNQGNNGWSNQGNNNNNSNNGWGNQGNQSNDSWGNQGNQGNQGNNGWGNEGSNNGWGYSNTNTNNNSNNNNNGWGNDNNNNNNNNNNGWGNNNTNSSNNGWGNGW